MKTLILTSALALGLTFTGSVQADTAIYNSKTTQNVSYESASGGAFNGAYLSSKGGSGLVDRSQDLVATRSGASGSSVAINTTYNTKTRQLVAFGSSTSHLNAADESGMIGSTEKPAGKGALPAGADVATK